MLTCLFRCSVFTSLFPGQLLCHLGETKVVDACGYKRVTHNLLKVLQYFFIISLE